MKLEKICMYEGQVDLITGLAIKGASNEIHIGGADSEVIKNPVTGEPYIPGSSLKGKMRSQLEKKMGRFRTESRYNKKRRETVKVLMPCGCGRCSICKLFGAYKNPDATSAPTRIIVRDCVLTEASREIIANMPLESGNYLEVKAENLIKRDSGTAESPRFMERVPAGFSFNMQILVQIFEGDNETELKGLVEDGLRLVELSYLGGSGSRGYGQVKFEGSWNDMEV